MSWTRMAFFFGKLAQGLSAVALVPLFFALAMGEPVGPFFLLFLVTTACSVGCLHLGKGRADGLTLREGIAVTGLGWLMASALGSIPYIAGRHLGLLDGFLESVSGFTGAGATVFASLSGLPQSILLWRAETHWVGGLGIIVFFLAVLPQFGEGAAYLYETERSGRVLPRMQAMAQTLFAIYVVFSLAAALVYWACGMTVFEAVCHSMSTIATGGFSTRDESAAGFHNAPLEWGMIVFMLLASGDFGMYAAALRHGVQAIFRNVEMRFFLAMTFASAVIITVQLLSMGMETGEAVRAAFFQASSVSSTTGFVSADFDQWPPLSRMCLLFMMSVGGCSGSTAGGIKVARILMLVKLVGIAGRRALSPQAREEAYLGGRHVRREDLLGAGYFFFTYCVIVCFFAIVFIWDGSSLLDSVALALTTMGNVGPGLGEWGATCTYAALPPLSKIAVSASMLIGRLEIFPMLALLRPGFWNKESGWD